MARNMMCSCTQISQRVSLSTSGITISLTFNHEWVSGDRAAIAEWSYGVDSSDNVAIAYHKVWRQEQLPFAEINQQTEYGNWYYAVENKSSLTHRSGADTVTRQQFAASGSLDGATDKNYRSINNAWPVFAFAHDLGSIGSSAVSTLIQLSLHQKDAVQFLGEKGVQVVPSLWTSYFSDDIAAVRGWCDDSISSSY
jgi:hypothetical protein